MSAEIEEFNAYYNGEVFRYFVYDRSDPDADPMDECGGYYTIDEARTAALGYRDTIQQLQRLVDKGYRYWKTLLATEHGKRKEQ